MKLAIYEYSSFAAVKFHDGWKLTWSSLRAGRRGARAGIGQMA
jgi:hypothetical protein